MKPLQSFRIRLLIGSILWTSGLLLLGHLLSLIFIRRFPMVMRLGLLQMIAIAVVFMAIGLVWLRRGLAPFNDLRAHLASMREGRDKRIEGRYPTEVEPLVDDLNALLDQREHAVARAIAKAGDLAHGLKTPLAVLAHEADRAGRAGQTEVAAAIHQQVDRMRRQVDYHLAHARAAASGAVPGARCTVAESADGIARTLLRLHADRGLAIHVEAPVAHAVRVQREDLDEMLGNLLDNACKWARSRVSVTSTAGERHVVITVDDDGPGLAASMRDAVLQRGARADQAAPGFGFGLAIVRDLADVYGGAIDLAEAPSGGLRARLTLPAC